MKQQLLILCAAVGLVAASVPAAQASGCFTRADGTRSCSANGSYMTWGDGVSLGSRLSGQVRDRVVVSNPYGEPSYRLPPFGSAQQSGITCYNIIGKPYTYKGGSRCPIS